MNNGLTFLAVFLIIAGAFLLIVAVRGKGQVLIDTIKGSTVSGSASAKAGAK